MMIVVLSAGKTFGQVTRTVNLNITLSDVLEMTVNQDGAMTMNFDNTAKYSDGIEFTAVNQIVVKSSVGYVITAKEGSITGTSVLPTGAVDITPSIATGNNGSTADFDPFATSTLSGTEQAVITKTSSSWNGANDSNTFDVKYLVGKNGKFANLTSANNNVIPVVYTVTQP
ncbi:hypothetical protein [Pedobacter psychroterrae]|uniref:Uncharacterized protein n=1 Tax=Pedobacter psychroterrae TaxID=2530453 RepID=A0A4R0NAW4_9SPHI|nr:hypothetical protein [Pedobacter psychroterrae]TCC96757.1 hypothetical protein EZ437_21250 [Pedobacter psychroterrae]